MAIISMTVVSVITGCSQDTDTDSAFQTLDIEQLESDATDIDDRAEYYEKNVEDLVDKIKFIISLGSLKEEIAAKARKKVVNDFNNEMIYIALDKIIKS